MQKLLWIALAGAFGAVARYSLAGFAQRIGGGPFPWGTMVVNIIGCLAFGLIWTFAEGRFGLDAETRLIILTGFVGAFTTFSTFIFETGTLFRENGMALAAVNLLAQNAIGLVFLFLGLAAGRWLSV